MSNTIYKVGDEVEFYSTAECRITHEGKIKTIGTYNNGELYAEVEGVFHSNVRGAVHTTWQTTLASPYFRFKGSVAVPFGYGAGGAGGITGTTVASGGPGAIGGAQTHNPTPCPTFKVGDRVRFDDSRNNYSSGPDIFEGVITDIPSSGSVRMTREVVLRETSYFAGVTEAGVGMTYLSHCSTATVPIVQHMPPPERKEGFDADAHREFMRGL
jgi:hypothetical protein